MEISMDQPSIPPLLRLPPELRQKIYSYLLAPHPEETVTTINYQLHWPYLDRPTDFTFLPHQLALCCCPIQAGDHIYTRYHCSGPLVTFTKKGRRLWILAQPAEQFNVLRPATNSELQHIPSAGVIRANKMIYNEAVPILYRHRNFLFLTGPSPRGRYQAYAAKKWLAERTPLARAQITDLTLICQSFEEDCRDQDALRSYADFSRFVLSDLPHFQRLHFIRWTPHLPLEPFAMLFRRDGFEILMKKRLLDDRTSLEIRDTTIFLKHAGVHTWRYENSRNRHRESSSCEANMADAILDDSLALRE